MSVESVELSSEGVITALCFYINKIVLAIGMPLMARFGSLTSREEDA